MPILSYSYMVLVPIYIYIFIGIQTLQSKSIRDCLRQGCNCRNTKVYTKVTKEMESAANRPEKSYPMVKLMEICSLCKH